MILLYKQWHSIIIKWVSRRDKELVSENIIMFYLPEEGEHFVVGEEVDASFRQQRSVSFLVHLIHLHGRLGRRALLG